MKLLITCSSNEEVLLFGPISCTILGYLATTPKEQLDQEQKSCI